jgi:LmbE family N-acetylglucosaminyl deacetylase
VLTWDAYRRGFNHADHRAVGIAAYDAVFPAARDRLYHPEDAEGGLAPHKVRELLLAGSEQPDYYMDVSESFDTKLEGARGRPALRHPVRRVVPARAFAGVIGT